MLPAHLRPSLLALRRALLERFGARLVDFVLFGSYARGEATEDSDVDVLIVIDDLAQSELAGIADAAMRVSLEHHVAIAPLPIESARWKALNESSAGLASDVRRDGARV